MKCESKCLGSYTIYTWIWLAKMFVEDIGLQKIEEVAITSKDTKDARYVAYSLSGTGLDALAVKCR